MSAFTELLVNSLATTVEALGESKLIEALQILHDKNKEQYTLAIQGGYTLCNALLPIVTASKTKIDDAVVQSIKEAIEASADANGVELK